ncbi:hypothetical protein [Halobiforma nitratireducens]|uniref:Uncharacterized protein n=1 Tax=Halobiforma nitratireducens JCM 10879 TaxID=1227454 RepID=M0LWT4_9EURY|nr:hypothetical protein [Halobiforma nitratireducens]EMA36834.1 hypothetical protein C446_11132 [Halobiforma nitratireducens JCM 10879]
MSLDDLAPLDSTGRAPWYWYVLIGYPAVSLLGIVSLARLTNGGGVVASSLGSIALLTVITAGGAVSLPAIWRDAEVVAADADDWVPDRETYVGAAIVAPLLLGILSGLAAGFSIGIAIAVVAFLLSTVTVCLVYLYNRHRAIGLLTR